MTEECLLLKGDARKARLLAHNGYDADYRMGEEDILWLDSLCAKE